MRKHQTDDFGCEWPDEAGQLSDRKKVFPPVLGSGSMVMKRLGNR